MSKLPMTCQVLHTYKSLVLHDFFLSTIAKSKYRRSLFLQVMHDRAQDIYGAQPLNPKTLARYKRGMQAESVLFIASHFMGRAFTFIKYSTLYCIPSVLAVSRPYVPKLGMKQALPCPHTHA